jgi:hypothetical protein
MNRYCTGLQHENASGHLSFRGGRRERLIGVFSPTVPIYEEYRMGMGSSLKPRPEYVL